MTTTFMPFSAQTYAHNTYLPSRPSPLSPRSANACPRPQFFFMSSSKGSRESENRPSQYSQRTTKPNPLLQKRPDGERERRRGLFLKKVNESREQKRWGDRGDQIQRSDYLSERRRWQDSQSRSAPQVPDYLLNEEDDLPVYSQDGANEDTAYNFTSPFEMSQSSYVEEEAEIIAQLEARELDDLMSLAEKENEVGPHPPSERYGSDDEDYDALFMDLIDTDGVGSQEAQYSGQQQVQGFHQTQQQGQHQSQFEISDEMDVS